MNLRNQKSKKLQLGIFLVLISVLALYSCTKTSGNTAFQQPVQQLPVYTVSNISATTYREFPASVEGTHVIEIQPQVNGYLDKILVDEGAYVKKGQILFKINDHMYRQQLNNAKATLANVKADLTNASLEVSKLAPLVKNKVVSDIRLQTAQAAHEAAAASVQQAEAMVGSATINLGYTTIKAPVDGYVGRIPFRTGSLVGVSMAEPLTVISEITDVYVYFSFSEIDFLRFSGEFPGKTIDEKIKQIPSVELILADNIVYPHKGRVEMVSGQFNDQTGAISLRARFPNEGRLLRSGLTGKVRIPRQIPSAMAIPQESTFELQDKILVFVVDEENTVHSIPITVTDEYNNFYLVENGVEPGQKVVYSGLDRLRDGAVIQPQLISVDSLLQATAINRDSAIE